MGFGSRLWFVDITKRTTPPAEIVVFIGMNASTVFVVITVAAGVAGHVTATTLAGAASEPEPEPPESTGVCVPPSSPHATNKETTRAIRFMPTKVPHALCGYAPHVHVVSTSALPIDLTAVVTRALPGTTVAVPASGHVGIDNVDLERADALVCLLLDKIDSRVLDRAPALKVVANCAVGVDNLDLDALSARGIVATNTPDVLTEATAEMAFTLALVAARRVGEGERMVRAGRWTGWALDQLLGQSLHAKTMGIVGYGRIGRAMARRALGFGMRVIHASPRANASGSSSTASSGAGTSGAATSGAGTSGATGASDPTRTPEPEQVTLDELFATADVISLHCPLTPETRNLVDARRLGLVKPTAVLVNTARGGCVDEAALADALDGGRLFAAGLDVYSREPEIHPRLRASERVVLAPHLGSATTETRIQMAQLCADAVVAVLSGRTPSNVVKAKGA